ncbi:hypothetical protein JQ543_22780 [Bradyrhizobium diazoefficiens]|nr:hypothetical protein [Bradyrhizobium diazoefficiens]MBR0850584.1 hypothetical protein [Bradyrhizobium diazoefficiens]
MVVALSCRMADPSAHHPYDALREPVFVRRKRDFAVPARGGERRRKSIDLVDHLERLDDVGKLRTVLIA